MWRPNALQTTRTLRASSRAKRCPASRRSIFANSKQTGSLRDELDLNKLNAKRNDYEDNRRAFLLAGATAGIVSFLYTAYKLKQSLDRDNGKKNGKAAGSGDSSNSSSGGNIIKLDSSVPTETFKTEAGEKRKVVVHDEQGREIVPTGNSTVPTVPRTIEVDLPGAKRKQHEGPISASVTDNQGTEYTLVGLGIRSVTFIGIQVYVVGFYVATQDIALLQNYLVKKINPLATTLIPAEKDKLRAALRDPAEGEETWDTILRDAGCRSLFRISPVRDTDFHHLRDGFVRAITGRSQLDKTRYSDDAFGEAMRDFKAIFNRGSVPKQKELLLCRDDTGKMTVMYDAGSAKSEARREVLGSIDEERLSRLLWLNYLAGKSVASESARQNIIEGVMEFVERPIGTVATQVL